MMGKRGTANGEHPLLASVHSHLQEVIALEASNRRLETQLTRKNQLLESCQNDLAEERKHNASRWQVLSNCNQLLEPAFAKLFPSHLPNLQLNFSEELNVAENLKKFLNCLSEKGQELQKPATEFAELCSILNTICTWETEPATDAPMSPALPSLTPHYHVSSNSNDRNIYDQGTMATTSGNNNSGSLGMGKRNTSPSSLADAPANKKVHGKFTRGKKGEYAYASNDEILSDHNEETSNLSENTETLSNLEYSQDENFEAAEQPTPGTSGSWLNIKTEAYSRILEHKKAPHSQGKHICTCGRVYVHSRSLNDHIVEMHSRQPTESCTGCPYDETCPEKFDTTRELNLHCLEVHKINTCFKRCRFHNCGKVMDKRELRTHQISEHHSNLSGDEFFNTAEDMDADEENQMEEETAYETGTLQQ